MKVGVIGVGFVGGSVMAACMKANLKVIAFDKYRKVGTMQDVCEADVIFVAVPTPTSDNIQDLSAIREVLSGLEANSYRGPIIIKSTVLPGTCDMLAAAYPNLKLIHNPEFLTERNAKQDFLDQKATPVSCKDGASIQLVCDLFAKIVPNSHVTVYHDYKSTELGKYIHNAFLATKVAFMNQMYLLCKDLGTDYDNAVNVAIEQGVIGASHTKVPGPDGQLGFGGSCFPKDTEALLHSGSTVPKTLSILNEAVNFNKTIRK